VRGLTDNQFHRVLGAIPIKAPSFYPLPPSKHLTSCALMLPPPLQNKGKDKGDPKGSSLTAPASVAAPTPPATPGQTLRLAAASRAQKFLKAQFGSAGGGRGAQTEGAALLREICGDLGRSGAVARLLDVLRENGGAEVSTFEFLSSGAVQSLRKYLLGESARPVHLPQVCCICVGQLRSLQSRAKYTSHRPSPCLSPLSNGN